MSLLGTFLIIQNTLANPSDWLTCKTLNGQSTFNVGLIGGDYAPGTPVELRLQIFNAENGSKSIFYGKQLLKRSDFKDMESKGAFSFTLQESNDVRTVNVTLVRQQNNISSEIDTFVGTITTPYKAFAVNCQ